MNDQPRPLESLEWYREAERHPGILASRYTRGPLEWLSGLDALIFHLSLFAFFGVMLFAVNLILSPDGLWITQLALAWTILLLMHVAILLLLRLIGILRGEETGPLQPDVSLSRSQRRRAYPGPAIPGQGAESTPYRESYRLARPAPPAHGESAGENLPPQGATSPTEQREHPEEAEPHAQAESPWTSWRHDDRHTSGRPVPTPEERASWSEASQAAWLVHADEDESSAPHSESPPHQQPHDER